MSVHSVRPRKTDRVELRIDAETKERWEKKASPLSVSEWLRRIADRASTPETTNLPPPFPGKIGTAGNVSALPAIEVRRFAPDFKKTAAPKGKK